MVSPGSCRHLVAIVIAAFLIGHTHNSVGDQSSSRTATDNRSASFSKKQRTTRSQTTPSGDKPDSGRSPQTTTDAPAKPSEFVGTWNGPVDQPSSDTAYRAHMIIQMRPDGSLVGNIHYPELACTGTLNESQRNGDEIVFVENIVTGRETCTDLGTVHVRIQSTDVSVWHYYSPGALSISAQAVLTKQ